MRTVERRAAAWACICLTLTSVAAQDSRINRVIGQLEAGKPVLGVFSADRSLPNAAALAESPLDFVMIDMEHNPLDFETLQRFLMGMLQRRQIAEDASLSPRVVPLLRLPQYGREQLQFLIKQALDLGVYGIMLPHIDTAGEALSVVRAARYPQQANAADFEPLGLRGVDPSNARRYWGLTTREYMQRADLWPLDPHGELLIVIQIENQLGMANLEEIAAVPGIGAIFVGPADLSTSLAGASGRWGEGVVARVEEMAQTVLAACKRRRIPCGITANADNIQQRIEDGFQFLTIGSDVGLPAGVVNTLARVGRQP